MHTETWLGIPLNFFLFMLTAHSSEMTIVRSTTVYLTQKAMTNRWGEKEIHSQAQCNICSLGYLRKQYQFQDAWQRKWQLHEPPTAAVYWSRILCWQEVLVEGTCGAGGGGPLPSPGEGLSPEEREVSAHHAWSSYRTTTLRSWRCNDHDYSDVRKQDVRDRAICSSSQSCLTPKNPDSEIRLLDLNPGVTSH